MPRVIGDLCIYLTIYTIRLDETVDIPKASETRIHFPYTLLSYFPSPVATRVL